MNVNIDQLKTQLDIFFKGLIKYDFKEGIISQHDSDWASEPKIGSRCTWITSKSHEAPFVLSFRTKLAPTIQRMQAETSELDRNEIDHNITQHCLQKLSEATEEELGVISGDVFGYDERFGIKGPYTLVEYLFLIKEELYNVTYIFPKEKYNFIQ